MQRLRSSQTVIQRALIILICAALAAALGWVLFSEQGQRLIWPGGPGFGEYTPPANAPDGFLRGKTLYDWLQLLIIPGVLTVGGLWYNRNEKRLEQKLADERAKNDRHIAEEQRQDATLQAYFDKIEALLLPPHNLREWQESGAAGEAARDMARVRTLTALRQLDATRRNVLLQFLRDAHLVDADGGKSIIDFRKANLASIDLQRTDLRELDFMGANLQEARLLGASLWGMVLMFADLQKAQLQDALLLGSLLQGADLRKAQLQRANLIDTEMQDARLQGAQLQGARLRGARLQDAGLEEAQMQDTELWGAQLQRANLRGAQLQRAQFNYIFVTANLEKAILDGADLTSSDITVTQLRQAHSFVGAKLPPKIKRQLRQAMSTDDGKEQPSSLHS